MPLTTENELVAIIGIAIALMLSLAGYIIYFLFVYQKKERNHIREKAELHAHFQKELLQSQLEIQEQTLKTISQEIHDNIGQVLSLVKLNLATTQISKPHEAEEKIRDSKDLVAKAITDLRDLSRSMNTDKIPELGLPEALKHELLMLKKTGSFETDFELTGTPYKLDSQKEIILFRTLQEAISNIIRHAGPCLVKAHIDYREDGLSLSIADDGGGFDTTAPAAGIGIRNMQNRTRLIGADLRIEAAPGKGTVIKIELPHNRQIPST